MQRVFDEEAADLIAVRAVHVDGGAPRRRVAVGEVRTELAEIVPLGAEVVVHDVEHRGQPAGVAGVHESLEAVRAAVRDVCGEQIHAVVPPVPLAGELGHRHHLDRRHAERPQRIQPPDRGVARAFPRERAEVELVENVVGEREPPPPLIGPGKRAPRHLRRSVHAVRLEPRGRIGPLPGAVEAVQVARARRRVVDDRLVVAAPDRGHRDHAVARRDQVHVHRPRLGRPHEKARPAAAERGGAERRGGHAAGRVHPAGARDRSSRMPSSGIRTQSGRLFSS